MKTFDFEERNKQMEEEEKLERDIEVVEEGLWVKLEKYGKKISFAKDIRALYRYMKDRDVAWYRKSIVVAALLYFIFPIDAVPDIAPLVGYLDDMGVIVATVKYLGSELIPYYE